MYWCFSIRLLVNSVEQILETLCHLHYNCYPNLLFANE